MKSRLVFFVFCVGLFFRASLAGATTADFPQYLSSDQTISEDVYMFGETVTVQGKVVGDLMAIGKTVSCNGAIAADLLALALEIEAAGNINDDIRAAGLYTDLRGNVGDDAVLAGFKVNLAPESRIGHTAVVAAGQAIISGYVRGDVIATGYNCILGGNIEGNATVSAARLQLTPTTRIKGNLIYTCPDPVIIPPGAVVEGEIIHRKPASPSWLVSLSRSEGGKWMKLIGMLTWDAGLLIVGALLLLLMPQTIQAPSRTMANKPWLACMYGFFWLVGAPVTASIGVLTIVCLPLSIAIVFLYLSGLYLSSLPVALWLGQTLFRIKDKPYLALLTGLLTIAVLRSLPYIGFIIGTVVLTVGLGSLALSFRNFIRDCR